MLCEFCESATTLLMHLFLVVKLFFSRLIIISGRPGGPAFYISTVNNVQNHGPASQGSGTEADSCFGKIESQSIAVKFFILEFFATWV